MSGQIPTYQGPFRFASPAKYREWLRHLQMPDELERHIELMGKPVVRVPVERQVPNEADL